eukprot:s234_g35.t1
MNILHVNAIFLLDMFSGTAQVRPQMLASSQKRLAVCSALVSAVKKCYKLVTWLMVTMVEVIPMVHNLPIDQAPQSKGGMASKAAPDQHDEIARPWLDHPDGKWSPRPQIPFDCPVSYGIEESPVDFELDVRELGDANAASHPEVQVSPVQPIRLSFDLMVSVQNLQHIPDWSGVLTWKRLHELYAELSALSGPSIDLKAPPLLTPQEVLHIPEALWSYHAKSICAAVQVWLQQAVQHCPHHVLEAFFSNHAPASWSSTEFPHCDVLCLPLVTHISEYLGDPLDLTNFFRLSTKSIAETSSQICAMQWKCIFQEKWPVFYEALSYEPRKLETNWEVPTNSYIDLVCKVQVFDCQHDCHLLVHVTDGQRFVYKGLLEDGYSTYTILNGRMKQQYPIPMIEATDETAVMGHKMPTWDTLHSTIDLCSGFGGLSQGAIAAGFEVAVAVDHNSCMLDLHAKASDAPRICGDFGDKAIMYEIWEKSGGASVVTSGFSCQQFSRLGDEGSANDSRSNCLTKTLALSYYLQIRVILLECVAAAAKDSFVKAELDRFLQCTGFHCALTELKLDHIWPCRRHRAWWLITAPEIGPIQLDTWMKLLNVTQVQHVIPSIRLWSDEDEHELELDDEELVAFGVSTDNHGKYLLNGKAVAPCALHGWGAQIRACPCGCRKYPFSKHRLETKGLHGCLVRSAPNADGCTKIRHINTMDPILDFGPQPRLTLTAAGQLACPAQALWIFGFLTERLDQLQFGKGMFDSNAQLQAYRSWLLARCRQVWPCEQEVLTDDKLISMIRFWEPYQHLSLAELLYPRRWEGKITCPVTIASVLDHLIRASESVIPPTIIDLEGQNEVEADTPWFDFPSVSDDTSTVGCMCMDSCTVVFEGKHDSPIRFQPKCNSTVEQFICAHEKLVGTLSVSHVTLNGRTIPMQHVMEVGQVIVVHLMHDSEITPNSPRRPSVSPTVEWTHPPQDVIPSPPRKISKYDVGECTPIADSVPDQPWLDATPLLGLQGNQFLNLHLPSVATTQQLWSLRHQFLRSPDRLALLERQENLWADDEIRFHLHALVQNFVTHQTHTNGITKTVHVIDPLLITAWVQNKGFDCLHWAKDHADIKQLELPVITAALVDGHWIPVFLSPIQHVLHVHTWDAAGANHDKLNQVLQGLATAMGFASALIQKHQRMFFSTDLCGALAIAFLRYELFGSQLPTEHAEAFYIHGALKTSFRHALQACDVTTRPWIWGAGDRTISLHDALPPPGDDPLLLTRDQRIDLIQQKGLSMADDEMRYHILNLVMHQLDRNPQVRFVFLEPLIFTCWNTTGQNIARTWCEQNPQVLVHGQQVVSAYCTEEHWYPVWMSPCGNTLQIHTFQGPHDMTQFELMVATISRYLGFHEFAIHRIPSSLPEHNLCGPHALSLLAHVIMRMPLPDSVRTLRDLHTSMRASFVAYLYTVDHVQLPVTWGNGLPSSNHLSSCCCQTPHQPFDEDHQPFEEYCHCARALPRSAHEEPLRAWRIQQLAFKGHAMGDDEIYFHLQFILAHYQGLAASGVPSARCFQVLPPLVLHMWNEGHSELLDDWMTQYLHNAQSFPHLLTVAWHADHWIPVWIAPQETALHFHTVNGIGPEVAVDQSFKKLAIKLGFPHCVIHRVPCTLPVHRLCGPIAISFLAHIVLGTPFPRDEDALATRSWTMKQRFATRSYAHPIDTPALWGWGLKPAQGLSLLTVEHPVPHPHGDKELTLDHERDGRHLSSRPQECPLVAPIAAGQPVCGEFTGECRLLPRMPEGCPLAASEHDQVWCLGSGEYRLLPTMPDECPFVALPDSVGLRSCGSTGECSLLPIMPERGPFEAPKSALVPNNSGECRLLPRMPEGGPFVAPEADQVCGLGSGECRLLPKMPDECPFVAPQAEAGLGDFGLTGECRLLPTMPEKGPFEAPKSDLVPSDSGECRLLPIMPEWCPFVALVRELIDDGTPKVQPVGGFLDLDADIPMRHSSGLLSHTELATEPTTGMTCHEMEFHVARLAQTQVPGSIDSRVITTRADLSAALHLPTAPIQFIALLDDQHWYAVVAIQTPQPIIFAEVGEYAQDLPQTFDTFCIPNTDPTFCGSSVLAVFCQCLGMLPTMPCSDFHTRLQVIYSQAAPAPCTMRDLQTGFGPTGQLAKKLAEELRKHGIPEEVVDARASDAIKSLGSEQILAALNHRQPWKQLKALGNNARFKFVMPSELDAAVEANKGKPVGAKGKGKGATKSSLSALELDPAKLQLLDGTFACQGKALNQILPTQIGPLSSGVVLMSHQDAEPYLRSNSLVSQEPLALVVLNKKGVAISTPLPHAPMTVPCRCTVDSEPVLAEAVLVQLGTGLVEKAQGTSLVHVDNPEVVTLKVLVYRDELKFAWAEFCQAPIRHLVTMLPTLKRCMEVNCSCPAWHNLEQLPIKDPIVDVWRRQFLRQGFKPCAADGADMYSVCIRIPKCILPALLASSGFAGAYCEPRTPDAREILQEFTVVWLPKATLQEAQHLLQTNPAASGLARLGDRRGLRVATSQAKHVHQNVRPDSVYLPSGPKMVFTAGPFPFGADRQAVAKMLHKMGWECRPLQPTAPIPTRGAMWLVQATEDPPTSIIHTTCGEVMIAKQKTQVAPPTTAHTSVGAPKTLALCGSNTIAVTNDGDPWQKNDPWGGYKPTIGPAIPAHNEGIQQMEERVQQAVMSKLQPPMEDDLPDRVHMLEGQALNTFCSSLHFAQSPHKYCIGGFPVPSQTSRLYHSAWRGVAVLSKYPTRPLPVTWPTNMYESSRALVTTTLVHDVWVTGGTVYGEPESSMYPDQKLHTEALLSQVVSQVCHLSKGPRYVAGDWNVGPNSLPVFDVLEAAGFRDLQDLALDNWGRPISMTCKNATRRDFCYVSRELQFLLREVQVAADIFPDHAVLWGVFHKISNPIPRQVWATPHAFPWPRTWEVDANFWTNMEGSCDEKYHALWHHIETTAKEALPFPVPRNTVGRAKARHPKPVVDGKVTPPKRARPGDVQPHFVCATFRHGQWLRQVRRLQSYLRHVTVNQPDSEHSRAVWGSILRATGFQPNFVQWWRTCDFRTPGAPQFLPLMPPDQITAEQIFDSFLLAFRAFESELHQASRLYARQKRESNPNAIFLDLNTHASKGVEVLTRATRATVAEVVQDDCALILASPVEFHPERPVLCNNQVLDIVHAESDCLWVSATEGLAAGMQVIQPNPVGTDEQLFTLFLEAWKTMWDRHRDVPPERWTAVLDFARAHLPRLQLEWPPLDSTSLAHCISQKKSSTSGGLDGVTLQDLKSMPVGALQCFCDMFAQAEQSGEWPTQVLAGRVTSLAKTETPETALDFRPITVFGLLFRCWGTHNARKAIRAIDPALPIGLYGSRPQRFAGQVWSHLLWGIESAYASDLPLSGIILDIQKAFNYLARPVVLEACALVGVPFRVLTAWAGALSAMPRRFQIHGCLSPPAFSNCGLPEGCAMSCLGMMVVDVLFHHWMTHHFPLCQPLSYVDDWQILVTSPQILQATFACLERFTEMLDLKIDQKKTSTWSISPEGRADMRAQGFGLVAYSRNLGAHVQFTKQHTNKVVMDRVADLGKMWSKLRLSSCPYAMKVRALKCAAWPRGLHGIAATTISLATYQTLRAGALKGLRDDVAGASAIVQLGMIETPIADPHFWAILQTVRLARDCGPGQTLEVILSELVSGDSNYPANSVTNTLLTRLQTLGFHVDGEGRLHDQFGVFSLLHVSAAELQYRFEAQWTHFVDAAMAHRPCFQGLTQTDPADTRQWISGLEVSDQALFRKVLNGTHITQDGKMYTAKRPTLMFALIANAAIAVFTVSGNVNTSQRIVC